MKQIAPHETRQGRYQQRRLAEALRGDLHFTREQRSEQHSTERQIRLSRKGYLRATCGRSDTGRADAKLRKF